MDTQSTGASDPDIQTHGEDQDRRGIDVAGRHLVSNGNAGESSPTVTTDTHSERLRTPVLPPSGLAPQGTRPEGSVVPACKSVAAPSSPEAGNGQVVGGRYRHRIMTSGWRCSIDNSRSLSFRNCKCFCDCSISLSLKLKKSSSLTFCTSL